MPLIIKLISVSAIVLFFKTDCFFFISYFLSVLVLIINKNSINLFILKSLSKRLFLKTSLFIVGFNKFIFASFLQNIDIISLRYLFNEQSGYLAGAIFIGKMPFIFLSIFILIMFPEILKKKKKIFKF